MALKPNVVQSLIRRNASEITLHELMLKHTKHNIQYAASSFGKNFKGSAYASGLRKEVSKLEKELVKLRVLQKALKTQLKEAHEYERFKKDMEALMSILSSSSRLLTVLH